jgi:hypothetical protein
MTPASPRSPAPRPPPPHRLHPRPQSQAASSMAEVSHLEAAFERITVQDENRENADEREPVASYYKAKVRRPLTAHRA